MAKLRQEKNILDSLLTAATGATAASNEIAHLDTTKHNGATYYFEVEAYSDISLAFDVTLVGATDGTLATINVPTLTTAPTLFRSGSFTPTTSAQNCTILISNAAGTNKRVKAARIVILQDAAAITNTETQIEIGNASATTTTTNVALTNPKYWFYEDGNWDGTITVYFEGTFMTGTSKSAATMTLQVSDSSSIAAPSWSDVASSAITTTGTVATRVRSGALTLTADRWYRAVMKAGNSKSGITVYNAKVIVDQADGASITGGSISVQGVFGGTAGSGELSQAIGNGVIIQTTSTITGVNLKLRKDGSPTDNFIVELVSSLGGSVLASITIDASTISSSMTLYNKVFDSPVSLTGGVKYFLQFRRSGTRDLTNCIRVETLENFSTSLKPYLYGFASRDNNTWGSESTTLSLYFELVGQAGVTKLEPQYLLANTLFAAGTALQTFLTDWDSTEWSGVTNTYYFQAEAANGSTSDVTLDEADGGGIVTNSTLTNIDNAQISAAMTMPTDQNLDTKATTNAGDVAAARILVAVVVTTVPPIPNKIYKYLQAINRSRTY